VEARETGLEPKGGHATVLPASLNGSRPHGKTAAPTAVNMGNNIGNSLQRQPDRKVQYIGNTVLQRHYDFEIIFFNSKIYLC
jgi:hypothetical protein